jgi:hypothetical protein
LLKSDFFGNKNLGFQHFNNAEASGKKSKKRFRFKKAKKFFRAARAAT